MRNGPGIEGEQAVMNEERSSDLEGRAIRLHPRIDLLAVVVAIISSCARVKLMISDDSLQHVGPMSHDSFSSWWTLQGSKGRSERSPHTMLDEPEADISADEPQQFSYCWNSH